MNSLCGEKRIFFSSVIQWIQTITNDNWFITADDPYANNECLFFLLIFYRSSQCISVLTSAINNEHMTNKFDVAYLKCEYSRVDLESVRRACFKLILLAGKTLVKTLISNGRNVRQLRICTRRFFKNKVNISIVSLFVLKTELFFFLIQFLIGRATFNASRGWILWCSRNWIGQNRRGQTIACSP